MAINGKHEYNEGNDGNEKPCNVFLECDICGKHIPSHEGFFLEDSFLKNKSGNESFYLRVVAIVVCEECGREGQ